MELPQKGTKSANEIQRPASSFFSQPSVFPRSTWLIADRPFPGFDMNYESCRNVTISFATEAWRRADAGELADEELYCCDAQWSGLYDRMHTHEPEEMERRLALAADYGEAA
jgi:hypothetical protein